MKNSDLAVHQMCNTSKINYKTKPAVNSKRTKPIASVSIRIPSAAIRSTGGPQHHSLCHPEEKDT